MKKIACSLFAMLMLLFGIGVFAAEERPVVSSDESVTVRFAVKATSGTTYTQSSTTLKGASSESMMLNQIAYRYPGKTVLILSARPQNSKGVTAQVSYQTVSKTGSSTRSTTTLQDALTESMARNQIQVRYPGYTVNILSMTIKKR